jgi:hypothetical protein
LKYSRLFENNDLNQLISYLNSQQNQNYYIQVLLATFAQLLKKLCSNAFESQTQVKEIVEMLSKNVFLVSESHVSENFIKMVITHLSIDYNTGMRFEPSEIDTLRNIIEMSIRLGLLESSESTVLNKLERISSVLKWYSPLKLNLIKYDLNRTEDVDDELATDILYLEKSRGKDIVKRLIELIKNVEIDDLLLRLVKF